MGKSCENKSALHSCMGKSQGLVSLIEYSHDSIVSKTIVDTPAGTITLFAFDKGEGISAHSAPGDAMVQILDGEALINVGGKEITATTGQVVVMPADIPHELTAVSRFKMILTVVKRVVGIQGL